MPLRNTSPVIRVRTLGSSLTRERRVTLLPEPDSPRMVKTLPCSRVKEMPLTALTTPSRVMNSTCRSLTSTSGAMGDVSPNLVDAGRTRYAANRVGLHTRLRMTQTPEMREPRKTSLRGQLLYHKCDVMFRDV